MPVFALDDVLAFPHPATREPDGLLAVGGSLSPERILLAYRWGIFPWYHDDQPILWWWLCPRLMVKPAEVHISHSVRNILNQNKFQVTIDQDFESVILKCSKIARIGQGGGTWIIPEMIDAYVRLHKLGFAHSVEVMYEGKLVGGLYGVTLGKIFTGESMFAEMPNASKIGFIFLAQKLAGLGYEWIDCQQDTPHMRTLGATIIEEDDFLKILRNNHQYILNEFPGILKLNL